MGFSFIKELFEYTMLPSAPSSWNQEITPENPLNRYKFTSIEINASVDQTAISRSTYSGLDFLGDLGGLFGACQSIGSIMVSPVAGFALNANLLSMIFRTAAPKKSISGPIKNS